MIRQRNEAVVAVLRGEKVKCLVCNGWGYCGAPVADTKCAACNGDSSLEFTPGELFVLKWQVGVLSGFYSHLADTIAQADDVNLERLAKGFPVEVGGFRAWNRGNLALRFRAAGVIE